MRRVAGPTKQTKEAVTRVTCKAGSQNFGELNKNPAKVQCEVNFKLLQTGSPRTISKNPETRNPNPPMKETRQGICSIPKRLQEIGMMRKEKSLE